MWRSFGSGLLTSWCICACTWWQYSFYGDCDSATDSERSTDCFAAAFTRQFVGGDTDGGLHSHAPAVVDNSVMPELVWMPPVPRLAVRAVDREVTIPRWRLAREGPFLEERSAESIRSLGPGCAFRNTSCRVSDYAEPAGEYASAIR